MGVHLKAAELREEAADRKSVNATALRALDGREGFVFALISVSPRAGRGSPTSGDDHGPGSVILEHVDRLADSFGKDANAQHRFEQFLSALNETLAEHVRNGEWSLPIQNLNALVGIAAGDQMFLSGTGDLVALFLHRTREQRYQVFNLFRSIQTEQALPTWEKTFAVVLDGELRPGDVFCVSNRDLPRFVSSEELNTVLSTLPPKGAAEKIRQYFPASTDLSLLILQSCGEEDHGKEVAKQLSSVSLDQLARTTDATAALLEDQTPKPIASIVDRMQKIQLPRKLAMGRSLWRLLSSSTKVAAQMLLGLARALGRAAAALAKAESRDRIIATARTGTDRKIMAALGTFNGLPKTTKRLMLSAVGIVFVLAVGVTVLLKAQARSAEQTAYEAKVAEVETTIEKAAGAVIYKDENQARQLYNDALDLAKALPADTGERAAEAAELVALIQGAFNELRHLVNIPAPTELGALSNTTGRALFTSGSAVYVYAEDKNAYLLDNAKRTLEPIAVSNGEIGLPVEVTAENGTVLFLDDRPGVGRFDLSNKLSQITNVKPSSDSVRWTDLAIYGGRLYVLEPTTGQIIKYNRAGSDFDGGTRWIKARSTDLTDAVSLAIDATVFILKRDGKIVRFIGGSEVGWEQGAADPTVAGATDIWTDAESAFVYVLDPGTERLIVYDKEKGGLVTQYRSDAFQGLTDFLVDEKNRVIYLLAGSKLYSITASHLK